MPTTQEIYDTTISSIEAQTGKTVPLLKRAFTRVITWAFAGVVQSLYKRIEFIGLQMFPQFASTKEMTFLGRTFVPLEELGIKNGTGARKLEQTAQYEIVTEVTATGATVTAGATLTSEFSGRTFEVVSDTVITSALFHWPPSNPTPTDWFVVQVVATVSGEDGALISGENLTWDSLPTGLTGDAQQYSTITEGTDEETWEDYRSRVLAREQNDPQGGAYYDYYLWATSVNGVVNAYPYTGDPGEVIVYCEGPDISAPSSATLAEVETVINLNESGLATRRPTGARVSVEAITINTYEIIIQGLTSPSIVTTKANIEAAVAAYFEALVPYIEGVSQPPRNNTYRLASLQAVAYSAAAQDGATFNSIGVVGLGINTIDLPQGTRYTAGTFTWI